MKEIIITDKEANQRLDKFLLKLFNKAPKSFVYKMLRKKRIKYNKGKAEGSEILKSGDSLQLYIAEETSDNLSEKTKLKEHVKINFKPLYEDKNILVVNKPSGCLSQKETADTKNALIEQIIFYLWEKDKFDANGDNTFTPALCNRLDRNTSGIVIAGKSVTALQEMGKMLTNGNITKTYLALVKGQVKYGDTLKAFLTKDNKSNLVTVSDKELPYSKAIVTKYEPVKIGEKYSLLEVTLKTGRPHQIRAHLAFAGFPVVGDKKYGHRGTNMTFIRKYDLNHQFLHSYKITFGGIEGEYEYLNGKEIVCKLPENLDNIIDSLFV